MDKNWNKDTWRKLNIRQQPIYEDQSSLKTVEEKIERLPPLVFAGEVRSLKEKIKKSCFRRGFFTSGWRLCRKFF